MNYRSIMSTGAAFCFALIMAGLYMQYALHLEPCPLCVLQRIAITGAGVLFLVSAVHRPGVVGRTIYGVLTWIVVLAGSIVSIRHLWLQSLPADQIPSCGPGFDFIVGNFPLADAFALIFSGSGECAEVSWQFHGLSIPGWTLISFGFMLFVIVAGHKR